MDDENIVKELLELRQIAKSQAIRELSKEYDLPVSEIKKRLEAPNPKKRRTEEKNLKSVDVFNIERKLDEIEDVIHKIKIELCE